MGPAFQNRLHYNPFVLLSTIQGTERHDMLIFSPHQYIEHAKEIHIPHGNWSNPRG